ncbi:MAG: hypothetical protein ACOC95_02385 [Planctomycetota bacterium]
MTEQPQGATDLAAFEPYVPRRFVPEGADLTDYKAALALGGSRPLPELFAEAGLRFDFSADTLAPLVDAVAGELETLE